MRYKLDERGAVIPSTVELTIQEVKRKGWLYKQMQYIPVWAHEAVAKHRQAYEQAMYEREQRERYGDDHKERAALLAQRRCSLWGEIALRQPQIDDVDSD